MATVTLTPKNVYQYESGYLTAINPSAYVIAPEDFSGGVKSLIAEFEIPTNLLHISVSGTLLKPIHDVTGNRQYYKTYQYYGTPAAVVGSEYPTGGNKLNDFDCYWTRAGSSTMDYYVVYENVETYSTPKNIIGNKLFLKIESYDPREVSRIAFNFKSIELELTYVAVTTFSIEANPSDGFIDRTKAFQITATVVPNDNILSQYTISSGTIRYKLSSESSYSSISFTGTTGTIPANTLASGQTYNIYLTGSASGGGSATSATGTYTTVDASPTVTPISPVNEVTYGPVTFQWQYSISTGTTQYAFDIQTSQNGSSWTTIANHVVSAQSSYQYTLATAGTWYWRIRGYNQNNVAGAWSSAAQWINVAPPVTPTITNVTAVNRPTVSWTSSGQTAYEVRFLQNNEVIYDSGQIYSSGNSYQADEYLADGVYTVQVAVINSYGRVSEWATRSFSIASGLTAPAFTVTNEGSGNIITITTSDIFHDYYINRNGMLIGQAVNGVYTDRFANGQVTYTVIAVTMDDRAAFATHTVNYSVRSNMLIARDGTVYLVNRRMNTPVGVSFQKNAVYEVAEYIGASLPEHNFAKMKEGRFTVVFKDYVNTDNLLGSLMFYADMYGNGEWVALVSVGRVESRIGNETTAELQLTYVDEEIEYA